MGYISYEQLERDSANEVKILTVEQRIAKLNKVYGHILNSEPKNEKEQRAKTTISRLIKKIKERGY